MSALRTRVRGDAASLLPSRYGRRLLLICYSQFGDRPTEGGSGAEECQCFSIDATLCCCLPVLGPRGGGVRVQNPSRLHLMRTPCCGEFLTAFSNIQPAQCCLDSVGYVGSWLGFHSPWPRQCRAYYINDACATDDAGAAVRVLRQGLPAKGRRQVQYVSIAGRGATCLLGRC